MTLFLQNHVEKYLAFKNGVGYVLCVSIVENRWSQKKNVKLNLVNWPASSNYLLHIFLHLAHFLLALDAHRK